MLNVEVLSVLLGIFIDCVHAIRSSKPNGPIKSVTKDSEIFFVLGT